MEAFPEKFTVGLVLDDRYQTVSALNHGSFGMVFTAVDLKTGQDVALKCLKKAPAVPGAESSAIVDDASMELMFHRKIGNHDHVVNLLNSFESTTHTFLVLEYCSQGDLYEAIRQDKGPKETEHVRDFMLQLIDAVEALHSKGIYHRDIKPENIFLTEAGAMKLGDFGLATTDTWSYEIAVGSDRYMAPEQFDPQGQGLSPAQADIWSIGICLLNILFSRNPFAEPAMSDTLFSDFCKDRQSLFDVFPNMSQDTFEVLNHCLIIDPQKRSLALAKDAICSVISFTTDDESLDEFCTDDRDVVGTTANREPLRTPSIVSPPPEHVGTFPWSQALHQVEPQIHHFRKLSVINDSDTISEDLFPGSEVETHDWHSKAETHSIDSVVDSGLGLSLPSIASPITRSKPVPIAGSLPLRASNALSSFFSKKNKFESKSWSDMWDEDEEERLAEVEKKKPIRPRHTALATIVQSDDGSDGRSTPRAVPIERPERVERPATARRPSQSSLKSQSSIKSRDDGVSQHTGFVFEDLTPTPRYSPPSKRSISDKWAALGEFRRNAASPPATTKAAPAPPVSTKRSFRPTTWRRNHQNNAHQTLDHSVWSKQQWNLSTDWRRSEQSLPGVSARKHALQLDGASDAEDYEWVGGRMDDLHL